MTPTTMADTFISCRRLGGARPIAQLESSTATGVVACYIPLAIVCIDNYAIIAYNYAYLDHLDKCDTEVEVGQVSADQTETEEDTDGNDGSEIDTTSHLNRLATVEKGSVTRH